MKRRITKHTHPIQLTVVLSKGHPLGRISVEETRRFRFRTKEEAEKEKDAIYRCGIVKWSSIK